MSRLTLSIQEGVSNVEALEELTVWARMNEHDPEKTPMTGVILMRNGVRLYRKEYRKGLCVVAFRDSSQHSAQESTQDETNAKSVNTEEA